MSSSVTLSIATNSTIAGGQGLRLRDHRLADAVRRDGPLARRRRQPGAAQGRRGPRARRGPTREHPFGRAQEKFFWALVSACPVFFIGCGINVYHGVHALRSPEASQPFTPLVIGLLLFSLALELWTFFTALREIGGWKGVRENRNNVTVLAVLLEDGVAVFGILLTLLVAGVAVVFGPRPEFDAAVAILVGLILGGMAVFLAALNRRLLIDTSDPRDRRRGAPLARSAEDPGRRPLAGARRRPRRRLRPRGPRGRAVPYGLGEALKAHLGDGAGKTDRRRLLEVQERGRRSPAPQPREPRDGRDDDGQHRQRGGVHPLPARGRHQRAGGERRDAHRREHDEVVRPCVFAFSAGLVALGQQRRAAGVHEVPAHAQQHQRGPEVRDGVAVERDRRARGDISASPARMTPSTPKRRISRPVKKPGRVHADDVPLDDERGVGVRVRAEAHRQRRRRHQQVHHAVAQRRGEHRRR